MKKLVTLLLLLILLPTGFSMYEKVLYKGWVVSGNPFILNNETYMAIYVQQSNTTVIYFPNGFSTAIDLGNNSCSQEWLYSVCQTGMKFLKGGLEVPSNIHESNINISINLNINTTEASISFNRSISKNDFFIGDILEIKTTIEKISPIDISNISFSDSFSDAFQILDTGSCMKRGNSVAWEGNINTAKKVVCVYHIKLIKNVKFENYAKLDYLIMGKKQSQTIIRTFDITEKPFIFNVYHQNTTLNIGDKSKLNISLKALNDLKVTSIKFDLPAALRVFNTSPEVTSKAHSLIATNLDIKKGETKYFYVIFDSILEIQDILNITLDYTYNNLVYNLKQEIPIAYRAPIFNIELFRKENVSVLRILNPKDDNFSAMEISTEYGSFNIPTLEPRRSKDFDLPLLNNSLNLSIKYRTGRGQLLTKTFILNYTTENYVKPETIGASGQKNTSQETNKSFFSFNLPANINIGVIAVIAIISFIIIGIITLLKSRGSKSELDREIERIKKEYETKKP